LLAKLKELGLEDNTSVMYSTDNGSESFSWPDGGTTMFRGEKNTHWEGGYRVPAVIRWPGVINPGTVTNEFTTPGWPCSCYFPRYIRRSD
jgi:arylsulfatase A-like enzyme